MKRKVFLSVILVLAVGFWATRPKEAPKPRVQFFLVDSKLTPAELLAEPLNKIKLQQQPVFTSDDLVDYRIATHSFLLSDEVYNRLAGMHVPPKGMTFVVTVNKDRIYLGAFLDPRSSVPFQGVAIALPRPAPTAAKMRIETGYPNKSFFKGTDPRSDPRIIAILEPLQTDKIHEPINANTILQPNVSFGR